MRNSQIPGKVFYTMYHYDYVIIIYYHYEYVICGASWTAKLQWTSYSSSDC